MPTQTALAGAAGDGTATCVRWSATLVRCSTEVVIPDGCRDIIIVKDEGVAREAFLTTLDHEPRLVRAQSDRELVGYRLQPGMGLRPGELMDLVTDDASVMANVEHLRTDVELMALIDRLARTSDDNSAVARSAGVSERTLQRHLRAEGLPALEFWRLLGRARRAASALESSETIADIALAFGYSDQAHMTRECARWFGTTPARLRQRPALLRQIAQPGLGNWTGEQISTR